MALQALKESKHTAVRCRLSPPTSPSRRASSSAASSGSAAPKPRSRVLATLDEMDFYANMYFDRYAATKPGSTSKPQTAEPSRAMEKAPPRGVTATADLNQSRAAKHLCVFITMLPLAWRCHQSSNSSNGTVHTHTTSTHERTLRQLHCFTRSLLSHRRRLKCQLKRLQR